ncbi:MAG: LptF/LptG family permease [Desulfurivibrio sp.]|nr:LptF/LptG family permease [Desulfurivibrio sp.]
MKLLDRYLIICFCRHLLTVLGGLLAIYLLVDFFERVDKFLEAGLGTGGAVYYLLLKIPLIIEQLLPVALLLAGIVTLGLLNRHHELMALQAAGLSMRRLLYPLLAAALACTLLGLASGQWLLPPTMSELNRLWYEEVRQQENRGIQRQGRTYYRGREGIYSFVPAGDDDHRLRQFSYLVWDQDYRLKRLIFADRASWEGDHWTLENGQYKEKTAGADDFRVTSFAQRQIELPETPEDFFLPPYAVSERSLSALWHQATATADTPQRRESRLTLLHKISYLFLGLPLLLSGIPLLLAMSRGRGSDLALAIPAASFMAFVTWGLWSFGQTLAAAGQLSPWLAAWSLHLLAAGGGWYFISRND